MMLDWIRQNKEWVFSGIGVAILGVAWAVIRLLIKRKHSPNILRQRQRSGNHSVNIQQGKGNISISQNAIDQSERKQNVE